MEEIIYQTLGILAAACCILSYQFKKNKQYLLLQVCSGTLFAVQFLLTEAWAAMMLNSLSAIRAVTYIILDGKSRKSHIIAGIFLLIANITCALLAFLLFDEYWYIALIIGSAQVVGTIALIINSPKVIRWCQLCYVSPCWLFNNIFYNSIGGIVTESFSIVSIIVSLIRFKFAKIKAD